MMEGNDENNIDEFALEILRRAKERSQVISGKSRLPEPVKKDQSIELIMEKLEKKSSSTSITSPCKSTSPKKLGTRPILKPSNDYIDEGSTQEQKSVKKTVTTFDAMTGDTIVESKTDDEEEDSEAEADESGTDSIVGGDDVEDLPKNEAVENEFKAVGKTKDKEGIPKVETTPQLSRTLKKLAEFHSKDEIDSPVHPHTPLETFNYGHADVNTSDFGNGRSHVSASRNARTSRLSALAKTINEWEDDTSHLSIPGSRFHETNNARTSLAGKSRYSSASSPSASSPLGIGTNRQGQANGELQGFSRRHGSPLKQIRERTPDRLPEHEEKQSIQRQPSPKKIYFGGSPSTQSPYKSTLPQVQISSPSNSNARLSSTAIHRSPLKSAAASPVVNTPVRSVTANSIMRRSPSPMKNVVSSPAFSASGTNNTTRSPSPIKSPRKPGVSGSPQKIEKSSSSESTPSGKPVSAIRMKFEAGGIPSKPGPVKPERSRPTPYSAPARNSNFKSAQSSSPSKKFNFGEIEKDPSTLSVAERAKLFEKSKFCLSPVKKQVVVERNPQRPPTIFTSSPCVDNVNPQEIDVSSVAPIPVEQEPTSPKKRAAPLPPVKTLSPISYGKGPAPPPPPPPPMPTTSTPTNPSSKRRSTSPARAFPKDTHSVKRIKVNAPKPGKMYPSLTDIETETETEGHCSEVESMDDSIGSEQSLGAEIETIAKACSPIRPTSGGRMPSRYRPSEDFSATFACAEVDALIDEALEGQDMTTTINCSNNYVEAQKTVNACIKQDTTSENDSASLERTVVSVENSAECSSSRCNSLNETPSEPDALEEAQEVSCSEADTTASSSFTTSPVALSNLYSNSNAAAVTNVENGKPVKPAEMPCARQEQPIYTEQTEEEFIPRPLMHTVSFYRKQQQQQKKPEPYTGLNDISEQPECSDSSEDEAPVEKPNIGALIRQLEQEVEGRNLAIAQASKALNWCKALVGFSDSREYIECERILLIETQRRLALLNSIHRLKTEGALGHQKTGVFSPSKQEVTPSCKGNMQISDISVTLRREFFNAHRAENQYHFIGLVKNKHHIEPTTLLNYESQKQGSTLRFSNDFVLAGLESDFQIYLEIYYLESAKEFLPHEAKYRINAKKDSKHATLLSPMLTPSKKGGKGDHHKPQIHSPAGPDTIKSSSFKFCGGLSIDISSLQRTYWELDKVSGPLTGGISLQVQCSAMGGVEHKGFLTLFEDVSGYGAWVRRWCRLGPAVLEFWKYPEDETEVRKPPLGTLNLHDCVTSKVRPAPRDVCARANTLLLVTTRAPHPNDKDTLVTSCHRGYTAVRHLISADTREERDVWCQRLNKALANLRAWDPVAKQSVDDNLF